MKIVICQYLKFPEFTTLLINEFKMKKKSRDKLFSQLFKICKNFVSSVYLSKQQKQPLRKSQ